MSAWVTVWLAVQLIVPPGARFATGVVGVHERPLAAGSVTSTLWRVTWPSLVTRSVYEITSPTALYVAGLKCFTIARCGFCEPGVSTEEHCCAAPPAPSSAQAWLA